MEFLRIYRVSSQINTKFDLHIEMEADRQDVILTLSEAFLTVTDVVPDKHKA